MFESDQGRKAGPLGVPVSMLERMPGTLVHPPHHSASKPPRDEFQDRR